MTTQTTSGVHAVSPATHAVEMVKDAAITALIAFGLALPLFGFRVFSKGSGEGFALEQRWSWVAIAVAATFFGRIVLNILYQRRRRGSTADTAQRERVGAIIRRLLTLVAPLLLVFAIAWPWMPFVDRWLLDLAVL
ncbi:MAG: DUF3382 domain-containing protein, partial [Alphaproteobacteria bacterium]|nr:DUF3382 domain-containing protein [Alphaproteobacteria bacterium]